LLSGDLDPRVDERGELPEHSAVPAHPHHGDLTDPGSPLRPEPGGLDIDHRVLQVPRAVPAPAPAQRPYPHSLVARALLVRHIRLLVSSRSPFRTRCDGPALTLPAARDGPGRYLPA